jgi:holo-[acyl-carrier-protein] synthase
MIYGVGSDICDVRRITTALERRGERFAQRVLGPHEIGVFRTRLAKSRDRGIRYLATRFSAKEAFSKAIGMGMRMPMTWRDCEIVKLPSGQPTIRLRGALAAWFEARGLRAHVSVTDEVDYAASFVVVEHVTAKEEAS